MYDDARREIEINIQLHQMLNHFNYWLSYSTVQ